jgi:hypothetical protein
LVTAEPLRRAWSDALVHAARLDHFTDMLVNAAELAGVSVEYKAFGGGVLALIAEPGASTRAELFKAWQTKPGSSRVGRWGELLKCDAQLRRTTSTRASCLTTPTTTGLPTLSTHANDPSVR